MKVNREHLRAVALRQARGTGFDALDTDSQTVDDLLAGRLTLRPHPQTQIPAELTWAENPFGQRNWVAQLHMLRWLDPLRRRAAAGDTRGMGLWSSHVESWIAAHPPQRSPGSYPWADMVDAVRAKALLLGVPYLDDPEPVIASLVTHGEWIANPSNLGHSNHALHQHLSLAMLGSALGRPEWRALALERLEAHIDGEYDHQGVNREGALSYWDLNRTWLLEAVTSLQLEGEDTSHLEHVLARSDLPIAHATRPDGRLETIGDTDEGSRVSGGGRFLDYVRSKGAQGEPPAENVVVYDAGYVFGRSGWGETDRALHQESFYSISFGAADRVHGHPDGGSITYFANGAPILVDPGKYAYDSSAMRAYVTSRQGHNVVHVPGRRYDPHARVRLVRHECRDDLDQFMLRDDGYDGVTIERTVAYLRESEALFIYDRIEADEDVDVESLWHFAAGAEVEIDRGAARIHSGAGHSTLLFGGRIPALSLSAGEPSPMAGWVSAGWGKALAAPLLRARRSGNRFRMLAVLVPNPSADTALRAEMGPDGVQRFMVSGALGRRWGVVVGAQVLELQEVSGSSARTVIRPPAMTASLVRKAGAINRSLRSGLAQGVVPVQEVARAQSELARGLDAGLAATLQDVAATALIAGEPPPPGFVADHRTRRGFPAGADGAPLVYGPTSHPTFMLSQGELSRWSPRAGVHVVEAGELALPVLFIPGSSDRLVVGFSGALDRAKVTLPRFERARSLAAAGANVLLISDPTLDLSPTLRLGWYLGSASYDLPPLIAAMITRVQQVLGTSHPPLLVGSSGGGFAALQVAAHVQASNALVINPQTDIRAYHPAFVGRALRAVFGLAHNDDASLISLAPRLSAVERLAASAALTHVRYVVNEGDAHHVSAHFVPFKAFVAGQSVVQQQDGSGVRLTEEHVTWGAGHVGPTLPVFAELLNRALSD